MAESILIIDDSEIVLERIKHSLEAEGYQVTTTTQTVGAARLLKGKHLVIIDWHMPGISGGEVLDSFRAATVNFAHKPLFYLYSSDPHAATSAKDLAFDGCFTGKGNESSLLRQVGAALRIAKLKDRARSGSGEIH